MFTGKAKKLTDLSQAFLEPANATHRQYEALRACFIDGAPSAEVARSFGYTPGSFRALVHQFRQNPRRDFFLTPAKGPQSAPKADPLRDRVRTKFAGLFLFLPLQASIPLDRILKKSGFPGSEMIPPGSAMRSLLALKLFGTARHGHVMSVVLDKGLALFAGLNVIPKRSFLTEYSCRINPVCCPKLKGVSRKYKHPRIQPLARRGRIR
jgi:hypothetical protein